MSETRVKIQSIIENQIPNFIAEESPLLVEFLKQYYISQEYQGGSYDLIQNIDKYVKLDTIFESIESTTLLNDISFSDTSISTSPNTFTKGFPDRYGIIKINDEIITYTSKTDTTFEGCIRGFSGVTSYSESRNPDELTFSSSNSSNHSSGSIIYNLSALFLQEFLKKIKYQFIPGFSDRALDSDLNKNIFIKQSKDFYSSKGTDESFKILFKSLYGENVDVIKPRDYLFKPSDAGWRRTKDLVVEAISGNPLNLLNNTLYQDSYDNYEIKNSFASITDVEKISIGGKEYFKLSFDSDYNKDLVLDGTLYGDFSIHPKTKIISKVSSGSEIIDVDSTVGFPQSGTLIVKNSDDIELTIKYNGKSINQFYNVTGVDSTILPSTDIRLDVYAYGYSGINTENQIKVRVGSVLSDTVIPDNTYLFSKNDTIRIKTLGISSSTIKRTNWIDNVPNRFRVNSFALLDSSNLTYEITVFDPHNFRIGDNFKLTSSSSIETDGVILDVLDEFRFSIQGQGRLNSRESYFISRYLTKVSSTKYQQLSPIVANVQNTYTNYSNDILVASQSIPFYYDQPIDPYNKKITISGQFSGDVLQIIPPGSNLKDHGFYTGDKIYYSPLKQTINLTQENPNSPPNTTTVIVSSLSGIEEGIYYVKRVDATKISLAKSPSNLFEGKFISVSGNITSNTIEYYDYFNKDLNGQNILKEIKSPVNKSENYETPAGKIGILVNGVEILNYKSSETVFYGEIESIDVTSRGSNYDVINPPILDISDYQGIGATGICAVTGSLKKIQIIDPGFDYINKPTVTITGGNGSNALAEVNMTSVDHNVFFNSSSSSTNVNLFTDVIGFSTYHKFRDYERIIYLTDGQQGLSGLTTESSYYVSIVDGFNIKLHIKESDAISGINTVSINAYGVGIHRFKSESKKEIISDIVVTNSGDNYQNKQRVISSSGINTATNTINIESHGYETGEEIVYSTTGVSIGGLSTTSTYIVKKLDENSFKLASVGLGATTKNYYLNTNQYIDFNSIGSGLHYFNYTPITVTVSGNIGVSTLSGQDFSAKVQPIFRGEIDSVYLTSKGSNYGSEDVINYNRQPSFNLKSGDLAQVTVVTENGRISEVIVIKGGSGYNSPPDLQINGKGSYARLTPIIRNGELVDVKVINGGIGYDSTTSINVIPSGKDCQLSANIQKWTVNLFQKYYNTITDDDGIVTISDRNDYGLQYCHLYAPRKLRKSLYANSQNQDNNERLTLYGINDLRESNNEEIASRYHSPIIGWAYDGNPIYGPYGYVTKTGGSVRFMRSGYELIQKNNRPSFLYFPQGFFNEDYEFKNNGDLDEHNGRFCVTPDFPNGTYAYFATINGNSVDTDGPFAGYYRPSFPYFIGNSFYSKPNEFNFNKNLNQDSYNLNQSDWFRNTLNYGLKKVNSSYDYIFNPDDLKNQTINVNFSSKGSVERIKILSGGFDYNVNDRLNFDNSGTGGTNASAKVDRVYGKDVTLVSASTTSFTEVEFLTSDGYGSIVGFTTSPHDLKNLETISVSGLNDYLSNLQGSYTVGIRTDSFITTLGIQTVGVTGLTTYFYVSGSLDFPFIRENDILGIGTQEKVKVLNVEKESGRIRVLREFDSTVSSAYSASTVLFENPRKFTINTGFKTDYSYSVNKEIYFNPSESVGLGTTTAVGVGTTVVFSSPGIGLTQIFVPSGSIYLKDHKLETGEKVTYSINSGSAIQVFDGYSYFSLPQTEDLYVARISKDFIGISTVKIGLGTDGSIVAVGTTSDIDLLYFNNFGTGSYHSLKTKRPSILGEISKNIITVSTASTHGLLVGDTVNLTIKPQNIETIKVKYDDYNRRFVINPLSFESIDVNTADDTIYIENHGFKTGDKVIYTSPSPSGGLINEKIYYVFKYTKDKIRLCESRYNLTLSLPIYVDITSSSAGTISPINPQINVYRNKIVSFDLSDPSLSFLNNSTLYPAFDLNFYLDSGYKYKFDGTGTSNIFEVVKSGRVGIDTTATVRIFLNDFIPNNIYYKFENVNKDFIGNIKKEFVIDTDVYNYTHINLINSKYSGSHRVVGLGSTENTFVFNLEEYPEASSYDKTNSSTYYTTNSTSAYGPIDNILIESGGNNYESIPGISSVSTNYGFGAIFEVESDSIGKIVKDEIENIGFDYPTDFTLRPSLNLPEILNIEPLTSFDSITVSSPGKDYLTSPELIVIDGFTQEIVDDLDLQYIIGEPRVRIKKNTYGLYNTTPTIIPINNSNGIGINTLSYNSITKDVTVGFTTGFSDVFPFVVGDKVLVENTSVGVGATERGFNSSEYDYRLFTITAVNPSLGGNLGSITYNMSDFLLPNESPGTFDVSSSFGRIIPEKYFPIFNIKLRKNDFFIGETVFSESGNGIVESWNNKIEYLKVSSSNDFRVGDILTGESSNTKGVISKKIDFESYANLGPYSSVNKGWIYDTGILNNNVQRISDNEYYQYFSYSLKSRVPYDTWEDPVSSLNHTAGFSKFSDLMVESKDENINLIQIAESVTDVTVDLIGEVDLNCVYTFDLASEKTSNLRSGLISNEIYFENRILTDYFESVGNRVLIIDDISDQFNSTPRPTRFSIVDEFELTSRTKKYFTFVRDKRFILERQILIVSLLHDGENGYLNQYGRVETYLDLGSFDFNIVDTVGRLNFYPIKYALNDYDVSFVSHDLKNNIIGTGQRSLGDIVNINTSQVTLSSGTSSPTTIVSIANTYRSSKVVVEIGAVDDSYYEFDELNILHDGSNIDLLEYGQLTSDTLTQGSSVGLGTYIPYFDGSDLKIDFKPNSILTVDVNINALIVSIASSTSGSVGVGTEELDNTLISSGIASITASPTPTETVITEYSNDHSCAYYVVSVEDTTNQKYQMSEVIVVDDGSEASITEYGILQTSGSLGTVGAAVTTSGTQITFTPEPDIDVEVRVFQNALGLLKSTITDTSIDFNNAEIITGRGTYEGTEKAIRKSFDLTHNQNPIFQRYFDGSDSNIVDVTSDTIKLPDHYFVSGEEVTYSYTGIGTIEPIGIAQTFVVGIGTTDKLPPSVYIVKLNESSIRLAASAEDALKSIPVTFNITSVGIGSSHIFTAKNQNTKNMIAIDNYLQSPVVGSAITTTLAKNSTSFDARITLSGITSFFSGDLIQINNEIMRINTVGVGSTNIVLVDRPWMGTGLSTHSSGDLVRKIEGSYNIVDNTIHFVEPPYGPTPLGSTTNPPNDRDWTGITTQSSFQGRTFLRNGRLNTTQETYSTNYIFDDISNSFNGYDNTFTLTTNYQNVSGFSTNNAIVLVNGIFQSPQGVQADVEDYTLIENSGISSVRFTGTASSVRYDVNNSSLPVGGVIVSVGSTSGFGLQPLVSAGGTAIVSVAGTISSISIGNSGSGYRSGIQTTVNVGVKTESIETPNITFIGTASISDGHVVGVSITNPGFGYTTSNPPIVVFDAPLSYTNIPLVYSSSSPLGLGSEAKVDIVVGQGSSVIDFSITNTGYGYGQGDILTVSVGGTTGIPTDISKPYSEFQFLVDKTYKDNFSGWVVGELQVIDTFEDLFDGVTKSFPLNINENPITIRAAKGSVIDIEATILIFLNDILQKPGEAYLFKGGSIVEFTEAPKEGDTVKVLFYKGSGDIDVVFRDILETVKIGDELTLNSESGFGQGIGLQQESRVVTGINTSDSVQTNSYIGPGVTPDETLLRPIKWCKQKSDKIVNGRIVGKDRIKYEPLINPSSYLISSVGIGSTTIYVDNVRPFFDPQNESPILSFQNQITFTSQDSLVASSATAVVSSAGTISSITINDGGYGYNTAPIVTIGNPVGLAVSYRATATSTISFGVVDSINITGPGTGYDIENPPAILIEPPTLLNETTDVISYSGDSGVIVGVGTTNSETTFDLFIPKDSFLRDANIVGSAITISSISAGDFFIIYNSNIGNISTSINSYDSSNNIIGVGTQFIDNVYNVLSTQEIVSNVIGVGSTTVKRITVNSGITSIFDSFGSGVSTSYYGNYSWGKIIVSKPLENGTFNSYTLNGIGGITTSTLVNRTSPLKYLNYTS